ncbi:MAG: ABC transporter ATP-binding protein [Anaerolineae bacterium]|nr:ABC transporter ATP-binding protein [Anaerolineae bacterium]MDW8298408.1 ABC transporter ATP-binding protein [Anaerolineae bacterium]
MFHQPVLSIQNLSVEYAARRGKVKAVRNVSFDVFRGETVAVIGESGCGKTTLALALVRLLPRAAKITSGKILFQSSDHSAPIDVLRLTQRQLRAFRWRNCAMVFQSALNALNPVLRISAQVQETARAHGEHDTKQVEERALWLFRQVRLDPKRVYHAYPHELSGGMRQRVLLALGLLLDPQVIILDEPTTALDVLTQRTIIEVLKRLRDEMGFALIFISHDLSMAAELAHRIVTMYAGEVVEIGQVNDVFYRPKHPYTLGLMRAVPNLSGGRAELVSIQGSPPDLIDLPRGCTFAPRCGYAQAICREQTPLLEMHETDHASACHFWNQLPVLRELPAASSQEIGS